MAFSQRLLERLLEWCLAAPTLQAERDASFREFLGVDDPRPTHYLPGADDPTALRLRFLSWFMFGYTLPGGSTPAVRAAEACLAGTVLRDTMAALAGTRHIMARITARIPGDTVFLRDGDSDYEVRSRRMFEGTQPEQLVTAYVIPQGHGKWLLGPGWLVFPVMALPGLAANLYVMQPRSGLHTERMLQGRFDESQNDSVIFSTGDSVTIQQAVRAANKAAREAGFTRLQMPVKDWVAFTVPFLLQLDFIGYIEAVLKRTGQEMLPWDEYVKWCRLCHQLWSATPQPDRGGASAYELAKSQRR